jgi:hypothetical protein
MLFSLEVKDQFLSHITFNVVSMWRILHSLLFCLQGWKIPPYFITIRRKYILEDSYQLIKGETQLQRLRYRLLVTFKGECGEDCDGLAREWFFLISKVIFNPQYGLFQYPSM